MRWIVLGLLGALVSGCGPHTDVSAPDGIPRNVQKHPNREGLYLVYYRWRQVIDEFGPGYSAVQSRVRDASDGNKLEIWDQTMRLAVPKYMEAKGLVPKECAHGVEIVSSGPDEAGGGVSAFRCGQENRKPGSEHRKPGSEHNKR